jgi:hypothetical protein
MAPNGHAKLTENDHDNHPSMQVPFEKWLDVHGKASFKSWRRDHPTTKLSYEDWCQTEQVYGPYLFFAALNVWNEDGSSVRQQHNFAFIIDFLMKIG